MPKPKSKHRPARRKRRGPLARAKPFARPISAAIAAAVAAKARMPIPSPAGGAAEIEPAIPEPEIEALVPAGGQPAAIERQVEPAVAMAAAPPAIDEPPPHITAGTASAASAVEAAIPDGVEQDSIDPPAAAAHPGHATAASLLSPDDGARCAGSDCDRSQQPFAVTCPAGIAHRSVTSRQLVRAARWNRADADRFRGA